VLDDSIFSTDPTFSKTAGGASQVDGNFVSENGMPRGGGAPRGTRVFGYQVDSHEKTVNKGEFSSRRDPSHTHGEPPLARRQVRDFSGRRPPGHPPA
jgi:hypothetical protein